MSSDYDNMKSLSQEERRKQLKELSESKRQDYQEGDPTRVQEMFDSAKLERETEGMSFEQSMEYINNKYGKK